jgi:hypothetical protein
MYIGRINERNGWPSRLPKTRQQAQAARAIKFNKSLTGLPQTVTSKEFIQGKQ